MKIPPTPPLGGRWHEAIGTDGYRRLLLYLIHHKSMRGDSAYGGAPGKGPEGIPGVGNAPKTSMPMPPLGGAVDSLIPY